MSGAATGAWFEVRAPAKVNPWLEVLGRREDGFHELDMTMLAIDLEDRVAVRRRSGAGISLEVTGPQASPDIPADRDNLVWRAAEGVIEWAQGRGRGMDPGHDAPLGLDVRLEKHIPSRAGLGGGSSDAAATVLASSLALGIELGAEEEGRMLSALGSDCAFFAATRATGHGRCRGRGEQVEVWPAPSPCWIVLLTPDVPCPTGAIYGALAKGGGLVGPRRPVDFAVGSLPADPFNRLETAALRALPDLSDWRSWLDDSGHPDFRLSGSGSSFFRIDRERASAHRAWMELTEAAQRDGRRLRAHGLYSPSGHGAQRVGGDER